MPSTCEEFPAGFHTLQFWNVECKSKPNLTLLIIIYSSFKPNCYHYDTIMVTLAIPTCRCHEIRYAMSWLVILEDSVRSGFLDHIV